MEPTLLCNHACLIENRGSTKPQLMSLYLSKDTSCAVAIMCMYTTSHQKILSIAVITIRGSDVQFYNVITVMLFVYSNIIIVLLLHELDSKTNSQFKEINYERIFSLFSC